MVWEVQSTVDGTPIYRLICIRRAKFNNVGAVIRCARIRVTGMTTRIGIGPQR